MSMQKSPAKNGNGWRNAAIAGLSGALIAWLAFWFTIGANTVSRDEATRLKAEADVVHSAHASDIRRLEDKSTDLSVAIGRIESKLDVVIEDLKEIKKARLSGR